MRSVLMIVVLLLLGSFLGKLVANRSIDYYDERFGPMGVSESFAGISDEVGNGKSPKLKFLNGISYDFGVMVRDQEGSHAFEIQNVGEAELELEVTGSSCKCTVGELEKSLIGVDEIANVNLTWIAKSKGSIFSQTATIKTNDPSNSEIKLRVHGTLVDSVTLHPSSWDVGDVGAGKPITLAATFFTFLDETIEVTEAGFSDQKVQEISEVQWEQRDVSDSDGSFSHAKQAFDFNVSIDRGLKQGRLNQVFYITYKKLAAPDDPPETLETHLNGQIVGPIQLLGGSKLVKYPDGAGYRFDVGHVNTGESAEEKIHIVVRGKEHSDMTIEVAEVVPKDVFDISIGQQNERGSLKSVPLTIRVRESAPEVTLNNSLKELSAWVLLKPSSSDLSPLKLWLTVDISKDN